MVALMKERKQSGFSLVELMVGMVLGLMLIAGAVSIYLASKRSYVEVEQVAALTESARFAEQLMGDSLRHAGFFGEVTPSRIDRDSNLTAVAGDCAGLAGAHNLNQFVYAVTATSASVLGCIDDAMPNTDVLVIKHVASQPYSDGPRDSFDPNDPTQNDGVIDTPAARLPSGGGLWPDRTYVMTNNITGVMFDGNDTAPTMAVPGGTVWEYQYEVFYIRDDVIPQLSRRILNWNGTAMELVTEDIAEGVENLRVSFGYDSNNDGEVDTYKTPTTLTSWSDVQSVEVFMLTRSATKDVQYTDEKTYRLAGSDVIPAADKRNYRRLISYASVSLRNLKLIMRGGA
jgi:type IV pilus assembly protein PilW